MRHSFRSMTYLTNFYKSQILEKFIQYKSLIRNFSNQPSAKVKKTLAKLKKKNAQWISPPLTAIRIQQVKSVTGIITGLNYVSWLKMSVPELNVLNWELKAFPPDFGQQKDESSLLALAYDVKNRLPQSDLYVMESMSLRESKMYFGINNIKLSSMLTVLLNGIDKDKDWNESVIFQKKYVLNNVYNIQVASERVSTRSMVENILVKSTYLASERDLKESVLGELPPIEVDCEFFELFKQSDFEKQEHLSLALLLTMSFIDVNLLRNPNTIEKIWGKRRWSN